MLLWKHNKACNVSIICCWAFYTFIIITYWNWIFVGVEEVNVLFSYSVIFLGTPNMPAFYTVTNGVFHYCYIQFSALAAQGTV